MKRIFTFLLALMMALVLAVPTFAEETYSITITNTATGHTYEAYQIFAGDLHEKVLSNIVWGSGVSEAGQTALGNAAEKAASLATRDDAHAFAKAVAAYLANPTESTAGSGEYTISGLKAGYYLVKDKNNTLTNADDFYTAYIMEVVGNVTAAPKGDKPTPHTTGYTTYDYIIHDTMSTGLTSNVKSAADVTIKVDDERVLAREYYSVTANGNTFSVTVDILKAVKDGQMAHDNDLFTYYTGVLNADAKIYDEGKQDNVAYLEYSNNPNFDSEKGKTPEKIVYDWTFKMGVNKVDEHGNALAGAAFVLSENGGLKVADMKCDDKGAPTVTTGLIGLVKVSDGVYRIAVAGDANVVYVIDAGSAVIKGLDDVTDYYLYETKAPAGYNLLKEPVQFEITASYKDAGANYESVTVRVDETQASGLSTNIENRSGSTLPSTGGIGTTIFYVVGSVLVIGAAVVLITRKRMGKSDK